MSVSGVFEQLSLAALSAIRSNERQGIVIRGLAGRDILTHLMAQSVPQRRGLAARLQQQVQLC
jgi:hypothetical protein